MNPQQLALFTTLLTQTHPPTPTPTPTPNFLDQVSHASCCLILTATSRVFDPISPLAISRRFSFIIETDTHALNHII